ncbi:hypothetical protein HDU86_002536 [Geranomyces michiganensis]|nr:hypothetical protein HDU86_002536 [Geranomyces michiganensis]
MADHTASGRQADAASMSSADPYVLASDDQAALDAPPVQPPVPIVNTVEAVPRTAVDKLKRILENGAPAPPIPSLSASASEEKNGLLHAPVTKKVSMSRFDSFRAAGKTVLAVNAISKKEGEAPPAHGITAAQAATRLTGVIFDNDGEIPAALRNIAINSVEQMDKMRAVVSPYKPMIEQIVYWENLKVALYFSTGVMWTWILTKLNFGFAWVLLILVMVGGAFRRNQKRLRRKINNELSKQLAIKKLETDAESVEWMNQFLTRFWLIFEPSLSEGIKANVDWILEANKPGFLDDLRLTTFTLGSQAPRVESIRSYPSTSDDILMMDWDLSFSPVDEESMSKQERQTSDVRHSKIELTARVGKGMASIPLPVLVTEMEFRGKARIQLKFMTAYPHIKTVDFCLLEKPVIDFNVRPLKGMDLMDTPGLSNFISDTIDYYTALYVIDPNKITIDLEQLLGTSTEADKPIGVLRVSVYEAKGLRNMELAGKSDPYAVMTIGGKQVIRTKTITNTLNPVWEETHHIVITKSTLDQIESKSDEVRVELFDWNNLAKDKSMGATTSLRLGKWLKLLEDKKDDDDTDGTHLTAEEKDNLVHEWGTPFADDMDIWKKLSLGDSSKGDVRLGLTYFPVQDLSPGVAPVDFSAGILMITVHQAKELGCSKNANPDCSIEQDGMEIFRTPARRKTNNPVWDAPFTIFVTDLDNAKFRFRLWNDGKALGAADVYPKDCIGKEATADWFKLFGGKEAAGRLRVTFRFTPVDLEGEGLDKAKLQRRQPVALLRLNVVEAKGLANVEMMGKSDPYTKLSLAGRSFGATHVKNNVLDPKWNEIFYAVCYSRKEMLSLSIWDWNDLRKDRTLGKVDFMVADLIKEDVITGDDGVATVAGSVRDLETPAELEHVGLSKEAWAKQERDGLKIVRNGMFADVWAPIYIQRNAADEAVGPKEVDTVSVVGDSPPVSRRGFTKVISMEGLTGLSRGGNAAKEPRQKGFLHFEIDYFTVVADRVLHAERVPILKRRRSAALPQVMIAEDEELMDNDAKLALEKAAEEEKQKAAEEEKAVALAIADRAELVAETLKQYPSGIVSIRLHEAQHLKYIINAYAEIMQDDEPVWTTRTKRKTLRPTWNESIDKYISNLPSAKLSIRIRNQLDKESRSAQDGIVGVWSGDFIGELLGKASAWIPLSAPVDGSANAIAGEAGKMRVSVGFAPVAVELDGSEASGGVGVLHIDVLEAKNVEAVDSTGASDPYCQLYLNGLKIHKTKVIKKSVNPQWKETVSVPVTSRLRSTLEIRVKDWNNFAKDVTLGSVHVQLAKLPPNEVVDREFALEGAATGTIRLRFLFDPQAIGPGTTSPTGAGDSGHVDASSRLGGEEGGMTKMGKAVFGKLAGTSIRTVEEVGRVATVTQANKKRGGSTNISVEDIARAQGLAVPSGASEVESLASPGGAPLSPIMTRSRQPSVIHLALSGTVLLHVVEARNLKPVDSGGTSDPFVKVMQMYHGKLKTMLKTSVVKKNLNPRFRDERCDLRVPPSQIRLVVKDHNTLGKDVALGEAEIDLASWFTPPGSEAVEAPPPVVDRWVALGMGGTGEVRIVAEYRHSEPGSAKSSSRSIHMASSRDSIASSRSFSQPLNSGAGAGAATSNHLSPPPPLHTIESQVAVSNFQHLPPPPVPPESPATEGSGLRRSMSFISGLKGKKKSKDNLAAMANGEK